MTVYRSRWEIVGSQLMHLYMNAALGARDRPGGRVTVNEMTIVAVDPGPVPGLAVLTYRVPPPPDPQADPSTIELIDAGAIQGSVGMVLSIVDLHLDDADPGILAVERYVRGNRGRGRTGSQTGDMAAQLLARPLPKGWRSVSHTASAALRWATDRRMAKLGIDLTGCAHARSALAHALYAAVHDGGAPDPLSRRAR